MKIKKKITSILLSGITALSATLSCLPGLTAHAALSRNELGWNQGTYNYMTAITKGITSLSTTAGINTAGKGNNQTGLKNCLSEIQNTGYTFNFSGNVKPSDQCIIVYDGNGNEKARCALTDNIYSLNSTIASLSGENYSHIIDYKNNNNYYGSDEPGRTVTAYSMDGSDNNVTLKNTAGFSIYDSRSYIGIAHNATSEDYIILMPDPHKCKIAMLYKNGGSYINTVTGQTQDVDVLVTCNNYDYADEEVPYLTLGTTPSDDDNEWAYLTNDMLNLLKEKGLTSSNQSKRSDKLIYRKLPEPITKKHTVTHSDGVTTTTSYKYEYVIPTYLISDATRQGVFYTIENYLKNTKQGSEQPAVNRKYNYPRRTQFTKRYVTNVTTACLRFTDNRPGIYGGVANWFDMNYTFLKPGTNTPMVVSGYSCWKDVDGQQGVSSSDFTDKIITKDRQEIWATGTWEKAADTNVKRYDWETQSGRSLTGYFDYKVSASSPSDTSNWFFATFLNKSSMNLIYSFWGAHSQDQQTRLGMLPSGWMMCDLPGLDRDFYATYRVQKVIDDGNGNLNRLENSEYGDNADHIVFNIGFVLTDEEGNVCTLTKGKNAEGETIDRGNYSFVKTLDTKDLTKGTLLRTGNTGYIYLNKLPLGRYKLVEAVTTKSFDGNQPIPASKMIFSDPNAEGNHVNDTFNGATVSVKSGQVSVTCQGVTINPVTTYMNISHIINFENEKQDYASQGFYSGIIENGNEGSGDFRTPVNARIINSTNSDNYAKLSIQKTITFANGLTSNANYSNAAKLLKNIKFSITNEDGQYAEIVNNELLGFKDSATYFTLNSDGQMNNIEFPFGNYTLNEYSAEDDVSSIWDVHKSIDFDLNSETCQRTGSGLYEYSIEIDNPEFFGAALVQKTTPTGNDISGIKFTLSGTSASENSVNLTGVTDFKGQIVFEKVPVGTYVLKEDPTTVPDGYKAADDMTVTVTKDSTIVNNVYTIKNELDKPKLGSISIFKYDKENMKPLSGADFTVYRDVNENGKYDNDIDTYDKTITSNTYGFAIYEMVTPDKYIVKETKAPDGYAIDNNYYPVTIDETHLDVEVKVTEKGFPNTQLPVKLTLTKRIPVNEINGNIWFEHGNPTFIFKVVNTTIGNQYNRTYYKAIEFTKDYVKNNVKTIDGVKYVEMSVTFDNLKPGTYTASEQITGQRYDLKEILNVSKGTVNKDKCNFTLQPGDHGTATFLNVKDYYDTNTHSSLCVNVIKK